MISLPREVIWLALVLTSILAQSSKSETSEGARVVCYYTNWSVYRPGTAKFSPQNINPYLCTHLIYAFGGFTKDNTLKPFDKYQDIEQGGYAKFTGLKTYNKHLKTLLAIGGWNEASSRFSPLVANAERRAEFVKNILKFLRQNHFDGIDLDWEYPSFREGGKSRDRENYAKFVQELRAEFEKETAKTGRSRLLITMAVPAGIEYIEKGYDIPKLNKYLDWFNILSYDYHSAYEPSVNHHSPLYSLEEESEYNFDSDLNIDHTIKHYIKLGAERNKLVLGIPTYGRSYTLFNEDSTDIGAPSDGPGEQGDATREKGYLAYYEICQNIKDDLDWTVVQPNPKAMGPYAFKNNQWVGFDDEAIVRRKAEYVVEQGLGGIMFWSLDNDDFRGICTGKPYPIIEAAKEALLENSGLVENEVVDKISHPKKPARSRSRNGPSSDRNKIISEDKQERRPSTNKRPQSIAATEGSSLYIGGKFTTPAPPTTADPVADFKCKDEGFFQHPRDCKRYYWCLDSPNLGLVAHQFTCPSGLYFNPAADSCDFARNVLCKKSQQATSTSTTPTSFTTTTTTSSPKVTAATSKNTFTRLSSTTSITEEPYDLRDEQGDEINSKDAEEDPRVIKELIDLIKKVGGIEELEKQLLQNEDGTMIFKYKNERDEKTTVKPISKSLYDRVLSRPKSFHALQNTFKSSNVSKQNVSKANIPDEYKVYDIEENLESDSKSKLQDKYSSIIRNSRPGPQNEAIEKLAEFEGFMRENPKYVTISRSHQKDVVEEEKDNEEEETAEVVTKSSKLDDFEKPVIHAYTNIRRNRPSTDKSVSDDLQENLETEEQESDKMLYQSLNRNKVNSYESDKRLQSSTAGRRYQVFSRNRVNRPQSNDEEFEDTPNVTVQDMEQIELTTQSSTQTTLRAYAVAGRRATTSTLATPTTSTILTDIINESQTTLPFNDISNIPSISTSPSKAISTTVQDLPPLLEISLYREFDHSTRKPTMLSTIESVLDTQEIYTTTNEYHVDDIHESNNKSGIKLDSKKVTVGKSEVDSSSIEFRNINNIKKTIDSNSNFSPYSSVDTSSIPITSNPEPIVQYTSKSDSVKKTFDDAVEITTNTELPTQSPTNHELLGTVSSPRPFGFPRRRPRPSLTTTETPISFPQPALSSEQISSLDNNNRSSDNNRFAHKKVSSSIRKTTENTITREISSTSAPKVVDLSTSIRDNSSNREIVSVGNSIKNITKTNKTNDLRLKHSIGISRVYPAYSKSESVDYDYQDNRLTKQYNWRDTRIPSIKWKQVPLDSSDVSTYKAYKYILNEDYRANRGINLEDILDDEVEAIKSRNKRSSEIENTSTITSPKYNWKSGRNSKVKWNQTSLDSSDISNLKSYRHYLSEDKEYNRKHIEQQKQDQELLRRLLRSIKKNEESLAYDTEKIKTRKLRSVGQQEELAKSSASQGGGENLVQAINEMLENKFPEMEHLSSVEEEDLRPLTSFKKIPYNYKYLYKNIDKQEQKNYNKPIAIRYRHSGRINSENTQENDNSQIINHFSNEKSERSFTLNYFSSTTAKPINSINSKFQPLLSSQEKNSEFVGDVNLKNSNLTYKKNNHTNESVNFVGEHLDDTPQSFSNIKNNLQIPNLIETSLEEEHKNNTKANRKFQFSFSSNQIASRGSFSYDEIEKDPKSFFNSQYPKRIMTQEISVENTPIVMPNTTGIVETQTASKNMNNKVENKKIPTAYHENHNFEHKIISTTLENESLKKILEVGSVPSTPRTSSLNNMKLESSKLTHSSDATYYPKARPPTTTPFLIANENYKSNPYTTDKPNIPIWKSRNRGTFRPKLEDFSSLLSHDISSRKITSKDYDKKSIKRRGPQPTAMVHEAEYNTDEDTMSKSSRKPLNSMPPSKKILFITNRPITTTTESIAIEVSSKRMKDFNNRVGDNNILRNMEARSETHKEGAEGIDLRANIKGNAQKFQSHNETIQKSLINEIFMKSNNSGELNSNISEIPLFTRRKYYKYLKDSPTVYVSKSVNNHKLIDSQYRIKEVFDTSFDLTTPAPRSNELRTPKETLRHVDFRLEPEPMSDSSSKVKISLLETGVLMQTPKYSVRKSKSSQISIFDMAGINHEHLVDGNSYVEEDMVNEKSSYYSSPNNYETSTSNKNEEDPDLVGSGDRLPENDMNMADVSTSAETITSHPENNESHEVFYKEDIMMYNNIFSEPGLNIINSVESFVKSDNLLNDENVEKVSTTSSESQPEGHSAESLILSNSILKKKLEGSTELTTQYPDIADRSPRNQLLATGSETEILSTRFPVRNRPTIGSKLTKNESQIEATSTDNIGDIVVLKSTSRPPLHRRRLTAAEATIENEDPSSKLSLNRRLLSTSSTTTNKANYINNEIKKTPTTMRTHRLNKRPVLSFYKNRNQESTTNQSLKSINDSVALSKLQLSTNSELNSTISSNYNKSKGEGNNEVTPTTPKEYLLPRTRHSYKFGSSAPPTTRRSKIKPSIDRLRFSTTSTTEPISVYTDMGGSIQNKSTVLRKRPSFNHFQTTNTPLMDIELGESSVTDNSKLNSTVFFLKLEGKPSSGDVDNSNNFRRHRPLNMYPSTAITIPEIDDAEKDDESEDSFDNAVVENTINHVKSSFSHDASSSSLLTALEFRGQFSESKIPNKFSGSQKLNHSSDISSKDSSTRKYVQINRNRSKLNSRFPGTPSENSEISGNKDISSGNITSNTGLQAPIRTYSPLKRHRNSYKSTDRPILLAENGYLLGYKPIGSSKAKSVESINSDITLDINNSRNSSTNIDIAHSYTSLEFIDRTSNTSFLNKNSNKRFQNKFNRTRTLGSNINTASNDSPKQVNIEMDSENTSTPSSSHLRVIRFRKPTNNITFINEIYNNTSTSTTITNLENREKTVLENNKKIEETDSEVLETLSVSELRRPFGHSVEQEKSTSYKNKTEELLKHFKKMSESNTKNESNAIVENSSNELSLNKTSFHELSLNSLKSTEKSESFFNPTVEYTEEGSLIESAGQEEWKQHATSEKIPESETAESNDESRTEISEPSTTIKTFPLKKITPKKSVSTESKGGNIDNTKKPNRTFFSKQVTPLKPALSDFRSSEEPLLFSTSRFRRPSLRNSHSSPTLTSLLKDSSHEVTDELSNIDSTLKSYKARHPLFPSRRSTTPIPTPSTERNNEFEHITKNKVESTTVKLKKLFSAIKGGSTTTRPLRLVLDESSIEETSSEIDVSTHRQFNLGKKISSTTESYNVVSKKSDSPQTFSRKSIRNPGFPLRSATTSSGQTDIFENSDESNISSLRSRFTLARKQFVSSTLSSIDTSQSTGTNEENTSRQPRVFERKFGRTRTLTNAVTSSGLNNAGVGFIDSKALSLAVRGRTVSKHHRSTTFRPDDEQNSEEDDNEESNEVLNTRPLVRPFSLVRPKIRTTSFAGRSKPNLNQPILDNEDDLTSEDSGSEEIESSVPTTSKPSGFQRPLSKPNVFTHRNIGNRFSTSQKPEPIEREGGNVSQEDYEKDVKLSNFNSKIYENKNSTPPSAGITKPARTIVNTPYAALNRLRSNAKSITALTPTNRRRIVNRPVFDNSTQSSLDREQITQSTYAYTRSFKRKFGKFSTTNPSTPSIIGDNISVYAFNNRNKPIFELTSTKHLTTTTIKPTQSTESTNIVENTEPTEEYESTTITATTIPNDIKGQTEMDDIVIQFQDDDLFKLDSTVDTTTTSNEEDTTLIDETLTQFQERINTTTKSPVTTSTEKETTLQHVFAIPVDERAETTTEMINIPIDEAIAEKTQDMEDEAKKIIKVLTDSRAIKPLLQEEILGESGDNKVKNEKNSLNKNETISAIKRIPGYNENEETNKGNLSNSTNDNKTVGYSDKKRDNSSDFEVNTRDKNIDFNNKQEIIIEHLNVSSTEIVNFEPTEQQVTEIDSSNSIKEEPVTEISSEIVTQPSTENNLIKIVTGQTIIFFDDYEDEIEKKQSRGDSQQQEKPILETQMIVEDVKSVNENRQKILPLNKLFSGKKIPSYIPHDQKSFTEIKTHIAFENVDQLNVTRSPQEKYKSALEEKKIQFRNKFLTQEKNLLKTHNDFINEDEEIIDNVSKSTVDQKEKMVDHMFNDMLKEIKEVELRSQEKMDDNSISEEEKKRLTAERLVEINKIVEVYLKEEQVRYNPKTMEIIRLGDGELKLVRPARTYKLGEISRIKHVSNVQIEGHSLVSGTTLTSPSYKQARNVRVVTSNPIRNALPSDNNRHGKVFVIPDIVKQMETSTITLEGLFDLNRHGKELNTVYEAESEPITTTTEKSVLPLPLQYVRPISFESDPLVISIANLDQVVLSKLHKGNRQ